MPRNSVDIANLDRVFSISNKHGQILHHRVEPLLRCALVSSSPRINAQFEEFKEPSKSFSFLIQATGYLKLFIITEQNDQLPVPEPETKAKKRKAPQERSLAWQEGEEEEADCRVTW
jgi:hypothetical protein